MSTLGVLMVAVAYAGGRDETAHATVLYWIGQVVVFTPVVIRLLSRRLAGSAEGFVLVIGLTVNQYMLKWMYSPDQFRFPDELQHWLGTSIINESGKLFQHNVALPPAVHFPGLAEMGASVSQLTGLSVTMSGFVVAGILRLCFVGALFATVHRATASPVIASLTCVIYSTALHYLFFNASYLYQAAALPFLMITVWATRRLWAGDGRKFAGIAAVGVIMTTMAHHVTAFALVFTLLLLSAAELIVKRPRPWKQAAAVPGFALLIVLGWILVFAREVIPYLETPFVAAFEAITAFVSGDSGPGGSSAPLFQLAVQLAGLVFLFALYLAVGRDMLAEKDKDSWRWALLIGGFIFFAGNAVRFFGSNGPELAGRLTTFTYVPISVIGAYALVKAVRLLPDRSKVGRMRWLTPSPPAPPAGRPLGARVLAGAGAITVLMIGARLGGWPPTASLLPGPYVAAGFERSVDEYGIAAAEWQRWTLGEGNRVAGDLTAVNLSSTYGRQDPVREAGPLFYDVEWTAEDNRRVDELGVQYLIIDKRMTESLPVNGQYFDNDPFAGQITRPISTDQIGKFDTLDISSRLYDNGNVRIYRLDVPS